MLIVVICIQYEDPIRQEAARKTVPVEELEEKALVSLAKVSGCIFLFQETILIHRNQMSKFSLGFPFHTL